MDDDWGYPYDSGNPQIKLHPKTLARMTSGTLFHSSGVPKDLVGPPVPTGRLGTWCPSHWRNQQHIRQTTARSNGSNHGLFTDLGEERVPNKVPLADTRPPAFSTIRRFESHVIVLKVLWMATRNPNHQLNTVVYSIWLVVWNIFYFPIYWECHHPNWLSYFSEGSNHQPAMISRLSTIQVQDFHHFTRLGPSLLKVCPQQISTESCQKAILRNIGCISWWLSYKTYLDEFTMFHWYTFLYYTSQTIVSVVRFPRAPAGSVLVDVHVRNWVVCERYFCVICHCISVTGFFLLMFLLYIITRLITVWVFSSYHCMGFLFLGLHSLPSPPSPSPSFFLSLSFAQVLSHNACWPRRGCSEQINGRGYQVNVHSVRTAQVRYYCTPPHPTPPQPSQHQCARMTRFQCAQMIRPHAGARLFHPFSSLGDDEAGDDFDMDAKVAISAVFCRLWSQKKGGVPSGKLI